MKWPKNERKPQTMIYETLLKRIKIGLHESHIFDIVKGLLHNIETCDFPMQCIQSSPYNY
jgi:hypothetical protein